MSQVEAPTSSTILSVNFTENRRISPCLVDIIPVDEEFNAADAAAAEEVEAIAEPESV
jgi:hypothetical protein